MGFHVIWWGGGLVTTHIVAESCMHAYCAAMIMMAGMEAPSQTLWVPKCFKTEVRKLETDDFSVHQLSFLYIYLFSGLGSRKMTLDECSTPTLSVHSCGMLGFLEQHFSLTPSWINPLGGPEVNMSCRLPLAPCPLWTVYSITFKHPSKHRAHQITHGSLIILSRARCQELECLISKASYYFQ